jgi:hypothetical protein
MSDAVSGRNSGNVPLVLIWKELALQIPPDDALKPSHDSAPIWGQASKGIGDCLFRLPQLPSSMPLQGVE